MLLFLSGNTHKALGLHHLKMIYINRMNLFINNNQIFSFFLLISSISFAGDFESKETAESIAKLYQEQAINESPARLNKGLSINIDGCSLISVNEIDNSFFHIHMDFEKYPEETKELYRFLKSKGFITTIGKIYPFRILKNKLINKAHLPMKKEFIRAFKGTREPTEKECMHFIMTSDKNIFHKTQDGIFLRNNLYNNGYSIDEKLPINSVRAQDLLEKLRLINQSISDRIKILKQLISESRDIQDFLNKVNQLPEQILPEIVIKQLQENSKQTLREFKNVISTHEDVHNQRVGSLKFINHAALFILSF